MNEQFEGTLQRPISPFYLLALYLEKQEYPDQASLDQATQHRNHLVQLAAQHEYKTDDPQLALLLAGCAINEKQRHTIMKLCSDQGALDLLWALSE